MNKVGNDIYKKTVLEEWVQMDVFIVSRRNFAENICLIRDVMEDHELCKNCVWDYKIYPYIMANEEKYCWGPLKYYMSSF